jgi:GT2 family glycosyltransferase
MNVSVILATCGDQAWAALADTRAWPSADQQRGLAGERPQVVVAHYPELSVAQARNAAAQDATCEWLCFLDADDELEPGYIAAMQTAFLEGAITTDWSPLLAPAVRYWRVPRGSHRLSSNLVGIPNAGKWPRTNECVIGTLVRADLFRAVGGFRTHTDDGTELVSIEDYDLWLRCWDAGAQLVHVPGAVYRAHVSSRSRNADQSPYAAIWADHETRIRDRSDLS